MEHLTTEQLKRHGRNLCSSDEMILVINHLDTCSVCFATFQMLFPVLTSHQQAIGIPELITDAEEFHLDYEIHLQPYVDNELDEVDREIVESHLQVCSICAQELRSLREFSESFKLQKLQQNPYLPSPLSFFKRTGLFQLLGLSLLLIISTIGLFWTFSRSNSQSPKLITEVISENSNVDLPFDTQKIDNKKSNPLTNQNSEKMQSSKDKPSLLSKIYRKQNIAAIVNNNSSKRKTENPLSKTLSKARKVNSSELDRMNLLSEELQNKVAQVIKIEKLEIPEIIEDWRKISNHRSLSVSKNVELSPNGKVIREQTPLFSWKDFANQKRTYFVQIFDENFQLLTESPQLKASNWKSDFILPRGNMYRWQILAVDDNFPDGTARTKLSNGNFIVLSFGQEERLLQIENLIPNGSLIRGIIYAENGLLTDAKNQFLQFLKQNPNSKVAKKFLRQIE